MCKDPLEGNIHLKRGSALGPPKEKREGAEITHPLRKRGSIGRGEEVGEAKANLRKCIFILGGESPKRSAKSYEIKKDGNLT